MSDGYQKENTLKRSISLPLLIFYGLGTMIGGGIYALTGKVAGISGMYTPIAFALSASLALITAFSYAELSSRFPLSAGEVRYVSAAYNRKRFSSLIGWLIVFTGILSAAALANATAGFIEDFISLNTLFLTAMIVVILGALAAWGITQAVVVVTLITLIEIGGLLLIIYTGRYDLAMLNTRWLELIPPEGLSDLAIWSSIFGGAFLAFYAFIGFEDMVNVAEEVKDVRRNMPVAIIVCIVVTLIIYVLVSLVAVLSVPPDRLEQSNTPLAMIMAYNGSTIPPWIMSLISMLATVNGILVQIIMASRVLYGMAKGGEVSSWFSRIYPKTQTPLRATGLVVIAVLIFSLLLDLTMLAKVASAITLFVFASVNAALLKLKWSADERSHGLFTVPFIIPLSGFMICSVMLALVIWNALDIRT
ncbi:MAG: amino acid permease [Alphaproteobacteria bacterium]|nr:amino acid permease [Alphaproteobacteria bacterium]NCQ88901.1 amino acid permease [Alphaproteobacteria bacterium]NCT07804.1 amino acid permease [Alphaproteobacteria bacterium]